MRARIYDREDDSDIGDVVATGSGVKQVGPPTKAIQDIINCMYVRDPLLGRRVDPVKDADAWIRSLPDAYANSSTIGAVLL